jgi:hypothetical protein
MIPHVDKTVIEKPWHFDCIVTSMTNGRLKVTEPHKRQIISQHVPVPNRMASIRR